MTKKTIYVAGPVYVNYTYEACEIITKHEVKHWHFLGHFIKLSEKLFHRTLHVTCFWTREAAARRCFSKMFFKILQYSQKNRLHWSLFLIELQARPLGLFDSNTGVFLWVLRNFYDSFFKRTPPVAASRIFENILRSEPFSAQKQL